MLHEVRLSWTDAQSEILQVRGTITSEAQFCSAAQLGICDAQGSFAFSISLPNSLNNLPKASVRNLKWQEYESESTTPTVAQPILHHSISSAI